MDMFGNNALVLPEDGAVATSRPSSELYKDLMESSFDGMFVCEYPSGIVVEANNKICQLLGMEKVDVLGACLWERLTESEVSIVHKRLHAKLQKEIPTDSSKTFSFLRDDGTRFRANVTGTIKAYNHQQYLIGVVQDVTDSENLVNALLQAQKAEAIGTLTSGIIHDINNLLFPILGNAELAIMNLADSKASETNIKAIVDAATRTRDLVQQVLAYGQPKKDSAESSIKIQAVIEEISSLLRATLPATICLQEQIDKDCAAVLASSSQVHQVVMNLCTNAIKAMEGEGGILSIRLDALEIRKEDIDTGFSLFPGQYAQIVVEDTGCGMDEKTIERLFEPYFTTRPESGGHGIGLPMVQNIVDSLKGTIRVYSEQGFGTTFMVYLPITEDKDLNTVAKPKKGRLAKGSEKIMVVDDDTANTSVYKRALERLGYKVEAFSDAAKALAHFKELPESCDLVITDMTMPGMTGDVLIQEIRKICPLIPVILSSGYKRHITEEKIADLKINAFLSKPATLSQMAATIREVFEASDSQLHVC